MKVVLWLSSCVCVRVRVRAMCAHRHTVRVAPYARSLADVQRRVNVFCWACAHAVSVFDQRLVHTSTPLGGIALTALQTPLGTLIDEPLSVVFLVFKKPIVQLVVPSALLYQL